MAITQAQIDSMMAEAQKIQQGINALKNPPVVVKPKTQKEIDAEYAAELAKHPVFTGHTDAEIADAVANNDFSRITNTDTGKPFTAEEQRAAQAKAEADLAGAQKDQLDYETQAAQNALAQKQADYQNYLITQGQKFQTDKATLDQDAANKGVLFSGGRVQKQQQLQDTYAQAEAAKRATTGREMNQMGQDFSYQYGGNAGQGLSSYYNLGSQNYNPNVATGGVTSGGLSNIYNAGTNNYQGTVVNANKAAVQQRATGLLKNRAMKMLPINKI